MARDPITVGDRGFTNRETMARKIYLNASRRNSQFVKVAGDNGLQYHQHGEIEAEHSRLQKTNTASVPELHRDNSAPCLCEWNNILRTGSVSEALMCTRTQGGGGRGGGGGDFGVSGNIWNAHMLIRDKTAEIRNS